MAGRVTLSLPLARAGADTDTAMAVVTLGTMSWTESAWISDVRVTWLTVSVSWSQPGQRRLSLLQSVLGLANDLTHAMNTKPVQNKKTVTQLFIYQFIVIKDWLTNYLDPFYGQNPPN